MEKQTPQELIDKYLMGKATPEEKATLESWYLMRSENMKDILPEPDYVELENEIWPMIDEQTLPRKKQVKLWPRIAVAAAAVAAIVFGVWFFNASRHLEGSEATSDLTNDIAPGRNTATLTLANGKTISLSDAKTGVVVGEELKYSDGTNINSSSLPKGISPRGGERGSMMLTASTPRGGTYQVILPDGTKVWLNADSKISFPVQFSGGIRKVLLSGEGYFEVAKVTRSSLSRSDISPRGGERGKGASLRKERVPFIVVTDKQVVEVLGTHFNIGAYKDEASVKTTLLEGSVRVAPLSASGGEPSLRAQRDQNTTNTSSYMPNGQSGGKTPNSSLSRSDISPRGGERNSIVLKPSQQAILNNSNINIIPVDPNKAVAWKNGKFVFTSESIESIMKKLARWYNVEVVYKGDFSNETFTGSISRYDNISKILEKITYTQAVHFKIEGRRVTVMP